ncbi:MAG: hypothetical protein FJ087_21140, partial [Deltaproteobacteria bacterium]|nr:hypothetical protein [Deltaproteobacteria bacterium]
MSFLGRLPSSLPVGILQAGILALALAAAGWGCGSDGKQPPLPVDDEEVMEDDAEAGQDAADAAPDAAPDAADGIDAAEVPLDVPDAPEGGEADAAGCDSDKACRALAPGPCSGAVCVDGTCEFPELTPAELAAMCNDHHPCTVDTCDPEKGCRHQPKACPDSDPCTRDACDPATGECVHATVPGAVCFPCAKDADCAAADLPGADETCLEPACDAGLCLVRPRGCDDGDACTADRCVADAGCVHDPVCRKCTSPGQCDDGSICTEDACADGTCAYTPAACPGEGARWVGCDPGDGCQEWPWPLLTCLTDEDCAQESVPCVAPRCNTATWTCAFPIADCDDGDPCTIDSCGLQAGCWHVRVPGCGAECDGPEDCDDGNPCTGDSCVNDVCRHVVGCDDGDPCTVDWCDSEQGCRSDAPAILCGCTLDAQCPAPDACREPKCAADAGACWSVDRDCDDGNALTDDTCDPEKGCVHTPVGSECVKDSDCTPPAEPCKVARCQANKCAVVPNPCHEEPADNLCTEDACVPARAGNPCTHTPVQGCRPCP